MPKDAKDVASGLQRKGFEPRQGDHAFYHLYVQGKKTAVFTKISQGEKEINDRLLGMMARQVRLSRKQFFELVECPLSLDEYLKHLQKAGVIALTGPEQG